ncbi:MAG: hypothetical protein HXY41_14925 [Chloroflexi bacterium]|nr:hypothetical protein [Chloroflexota bacterium]
MISGRLNALRHSVPNLVVAQRVLDKMAAAASSYIADETGEAMVGLLVPGTHTNGIPTLYVLDTIAPDETAVRQLHTFQQGDERQDEMIWWLQENWRVGREKRQSADRKPLETKWDVPLRYLGDWHKQPGFMIQPSQGDLMTAKNWIADPTNGMDFLLAPIVTLGHPSASAGAAGANFVTVPQDDDTCMRVDFWYLDSHSRDFLPIAPTVYPNEQLPSLVAYPWHLVKEARFNAEYGLLQKDGLLTSLVLWEASGELPLAVCLLTARLGWNRLLILVTPWNYPAAPPTARSAPFVEMSPDDDIYAVFESVWKESEPVTDPPGWSWSEGRYLIDYIYALEAALDIREKSPAGGGGESSSGEGAENGESSSEDVL